MGTAIDHRDLLQVGQVDINVRPGCLQLERLGVCSEFVFLFPAFVGRGIDYRNCASLIVAVSNVDELLPGIIAEIVDVVPEVDGSDEIQGVSVVDVELAFVAADKDLVGRRRVDDALRPGHGDAVNNSASAEVDGLLGVVAESGNKEMAFGVNTEVVDASLNVRKGCGSGQDERLGTDFLCRRDCLCTCRYGRGQYHREGQSSLAPSILRHSVLT